jgi:hypothetical protein
MIAQAHLARAFMLGFAIVLVSWARQSHGLSFGAAVNQILRAGAGKADWGDDSDKKQIRIHKDQKALCRRARRLVVGLDADKLHWWSMYNPRPVLYPLNIFNHPLLT